MKYKKLIVIGLLTVMTVLGAGCYIAPYPYHYHHYYQPHYSIPYHH